MLSNASKNKIICEVLSTVNGNIVSGIHPADEVEDYGIWYSQYCGEALQDMYLSDPNMTIEDCIDIAMQLSKIINGTKTMFDETAVDNNIKTSTPVWTKAEAETAATVSGNTGTTIGATVSGKPM